VSERDGERGEGRGGEGRVCVCLQQWWLIIGEVDGVDVNRGQTACTQHSIHTHTLTHSLTH